MLRTSISLTRLALWIALRKPAPGIIPRTGPKTVGLNNFVAELGERDGEWSVLANALGKDGLMGDWWDSDAYSCPVSIPNVWLKSAPIQITHYVGTYENTYRSALGFLAGQLFFHSFFTIARDKIEQRLFNRHKLVRTERIEVLRLILERTITNRRFSLSSTSLMSALYSNRWVFHPEKDEYLAYCRLLLDSLVGSGDLLQQGGSYRIVSKALSTLAEFELQDRKHRDQVRQQVVLGWLTAALVFIGLVQAYVTWAHP